MPDRKTEAVNLRMSTEMKELLRKAAYREHRTLSNMLEVLILDYCERTGIAAAKDGQPPEQGRRRVKSR